MPAAQLLPAADRGLLLAEFRAELGRRRAGGGLSQARLASRMGFDRTTVNKVERGAMEPSREFARRAELVLEADGELWRRWTAFDAARRPPRPPGARLDQPAPGPGPAAAAGEGVEAERRRHLLRRGRRVRGGRPRAGRQHLVPAPGGTALAPPASRPLPFRSLLGDPFDLARRPLLPSIDTLTIRRSRHGASFVLHQRDAGQVAWPAACTT